MVITQSSPATLYSDGIAVSGEQSSVHRCRSKRQSSLQRSIDPLCTRRPRAFMLAASHLRTGVHCGRWRLLGQSNACQRSWEHALSQSRSAGKMTLELSGVLELHRRQLAREWRSALARGDRQRRDGHLKRVGWATNASTSIAWAGPTQTGWRVLPQRGRALVPGANLRGGAAECRATMDFV
jgi:hypothetical protein